MGNKRYIRLRELESAGYLQLGDTAHCPQCGKANCCYLHKWAYRKWWEKTRPSIEVTMRPRIH